MKVAFEDKEYFVEFRHGMLAVKRFQKGIETHIGREATTCNIRDAKSPSPGDGTFPVIATATAVRYHLDPPNRDLARKAALSKALKALDEFLFQADALPLQSGVTNALSRPKRRRAAFWDAWRDRNSVPLKALAQRSRSVAQLAFLGAVYGSHAPSMRIVDLSAFAKGHGFTASIMVGEIEDAVYRRLVSRVCGCAAGCYCGRPGHHTYLTAPRNLFIENTGTSHKSQSIAVSRDPGTAQPGTAVASGMIGGPK